MASFGVSRATIYRALNAPDLAATPVGRLLVTDPDLALPAGYATLLEDLKRDVAATRWRAQQVVNTELVALYWRLGRAILDRQKAEGWGTRVIDRLAADLRAAFPEMREHDWYAATALEHGWSRNVLTHPVT